jgi:hypothetical protein
VPPLLGSERELDEIARAESITRAELLRKAAEAFVSNYKNDQLEERQLEKQIRALLVKAIRINGQNLYFATLPYTVGTPKYRLNQKGFQMLYNKSAAFAAHLLKSKVMAMEPDELSSDVPSDE